MKFLDIYNALISMERTVESMGIDLDRIINDESKGILSDEFNAISESYMHLYNADISLDVNLNSVRKQVDVCMKNVDVF